MATTCSGADSESEVAQHNIPFDTGGSGDECAPLCTIDTHPSNNILATGDISGQINLYSYAPRQDCSLLRTLNHLDNDSSCRALKFSSNGKRLFCGYGLKDVTSTDVETGQLLRSFKAHRAPLYSMLTISEGVLATGDDRGEIKIWDTRSWKSTFHLRENHDFISSMVVDDNKQTLVVASGDGSLSAIDLRQRQLEQKSDCNESELLSLALVKGGKKVVCGDGEGTLLIYNWGLWGDITDRFPSHSQSIDSLIALNDSVVCTGCRDGVVRSVQILPNQILGSVGQHSADTFAIDTICLSHDREYLVTSSHDCCKFWSTDVIPTLPSGNDLGKKTKRELADRNEGYVRSKKRKKHKQDSGDNDFFADL